MRRSSSRPATACSTPPVTATATVEPRQHAPRAHLYAADRAIGAPYPPNQPPRQHAARILGASACIETAARQYH